MSDFEKAINMLEHMVSTSIPAPQMRRMVREAIVVLNREARCKREREAAAEGFSNCPRVKCSSMRTT